ncbi:MAG: YDG domain-containing protein [Gammaproteobacteria bacterium]
MNHSLKNSAIASAVAAALAAASPLHAAPTGGNVVAGNATITSTPANTLIHQTSQNVALDWQSFNIGRNESVRFDQPNGQSVALNRVLGADASNILGSLSANGKVFLVNPNGVLFGKSAQVAVGGLVASTRDISVTDFMAGHYKFSGSGNGVVVNEGSIDADGGYVALLGAQVSNEGVIAAKLGTIALASGNGFTLDVAGDGLLNVSVDAGAVGALAQNGGLIRADGGQVLLTAQSASNLLPAAVNNTGVIQAQTLSNHNGTIRLLGDLRNGTANIDGTLDASAPAGGDGGFIETSAAHVTIAPGAGITTAAAHGATGELLIDPVDYTIAATGGDITGAALGTLLAASNVSIQSTSGAAGSNGDVNVNDGVSWSANQLTLNALGNINVNAPMNGSGTASLAFQYGQGAVAAGNTAALNIRAPVSLPTGSNLSTQLGSDGSVLSYSVINTMTALQAINTGLAGNYALGSDLNASGFSGYVPIGNNASRFTGTFNGLAHTISNLSISQNANDAGLFGVLDTTALVTSVRMNNTFVSIGGQSNAGSLVGHNLGTVRDAYTANVNIYSGRQAAGLVGYNEGLIETSAAVGGHTDATFYSGALVGYNNTAGVIRNSYASVNSGSYLEVGGLVGGMDNGTIENSYADSTPSGANATFGTGGFAGYVGGGTVTNSFWNQSKYSQATWNGDTAGVTGLTTAGMKTQSNFTGAGWDFTNVWYMYEGSTTPLLRAFLTPLTVTANNASAAYSGHAYSGSPGVSYSATPNMSNVLGTASYTGGGTNVGSYSLTPGGLYSNQLGYRITFVNGTLTIDPYAVSLVGSRAYDGANVIAASDLTLGTLANGETLALTGGGTVASKDVGSGKTVTLGTLALANGTGSASNYTFSGGTQTVDITTKTLTATASALNKEYDGNTSASVTLTGLTGLVGTETIGTSAAGTFNSKNVIAANTVTVNSVSLSDGSNGGLAGNYSLASGQTASASITAKALSATATASDKIYDGTTSASVSLGGLTGLVGNETLGASGAGVFNSKNVASADHVTVSSTTLTDGSNGGLASNYSLASGQTALASITAKALSATATASNKVYDGTTSASVSLNSLTGLVGSETLGASGTGVFNSKDVTGADHVTVTSTALTDGSNGGLATNYSLASGQTASASITPKALGVLGQVAADKEYDGTTSATLSGGTLSGVIANDMVTLTEAGAFASAAVASNVAVTTSDSIAGAAAENYSLTQPTGLTANITAVPAAPPVTPPVTPPVAPPDTPPVTPPVTPPINVTTTLPYRSALGAVTADAVGNIQPSPTTGFTGGHAETGSSVKATSFPGLNLTIEREVDDVVMDLD